MTERQRVEVAVRIGRLLDSLGDGPVFVHADPFRAARLIDPTRDRDELLDRHLDLIRSAAGDRAIWMPAFNYDFPRTGVFNVGDDPCQLGPVPERFRTQEARWRTPIPIFSVAGTGERREVTWGDYTDPFGDESMFAELVRSNGVILYYGRTFHYNTIVHYSERRSGGPSYRYDKLFPGTVTYRDGSQLRGSLRYHVRPLGFGLEYDWDRLLSDSVSAGACSVLEGYPEVLAASAQSIDAFFVDEMRRDPLALLDRTTRAWVEPALNKLGRAFDITDFESAEPRVPAAVRS
ncbi:MAG TPA: AAC(3) family N-acetyltransferase [Gemmatimonadaceae bacterium]|jgi:aminoglycoside N3'-acetyltransferase